MSTINRPPTDNTNATFSEWMARIDRALMRYFGITTADLADHRYRDAYDDGMTVRDMIDVLIWEDDMLNMFVGASE